MLQWALAFLIIALISAIFAFAGATPAAVMIGKMLFYAFLAGFIIMLGVAWYVGNKITKMP